MIAVSDTSSITNLAAIGQFDLLRGLYGEIHIPAAVWQELNARGRRWPGADEVGAASWVRRHEVRDQRLVAALKRDLGGGEAAGIALALELGADLVLLDEKEGRHVARDLGLRVVGVVGVLLAAKARGLVAQVRPHLDDLRRKAGFYLAERVYRAALVLAGEKLDG